MNKQQIEKVKRDLAFGVSDRCFRDPYCGECNYYGSNGVCNFNNKNVMRDALSVIEELQAEIERLQPKKGKWIFTGQKNAYGGTVIQCPFCDDKYAAEYPCAEHFCRNCGAKLMD